MSLVWLPFSVSAEILLSSIDKNSCHEMNSTMPGHDMSVQSMYPTMSGQTAEVDDSMINSAIHKSMMKKGCCDHCDNNCIACSGMSSCSHGSHHASPFALSTQYFFQPLYLAQSFIEQFVQYHNQIITPDNRPPVV